MKLSPKTAMLLVVALLAAGTVHAQSNVVEIFSGGNFDEPALDYNSLNEEYLVVGVDNTPSPDEVWVQRVAFRRGKAKRISNPRLALTNAFEPDVSHNPTNNTYLLVAEDSSADGIIMTRLAERGAPIGNPKFIDNATCGTDDPSVDYNSTTNTWLVVWHCGATDTVWGNIIHENGARAGGPFMIHASADDIDEVSVSYNKVHNSYLVIWTNEDEDAIEAQRLKGNGKLRGGMLTLDTGLGADVSSAVDFVEATARWLAVWGDNNAPGAIKGRFVKQRGTLLPIFTIGDGAASGREEHPGVAYNPARGFSLVAWEDYNGSEDDIAGQWVKPKRGLRGGNFDIIATGDDEEPPADNHYFVGCSDIQKRWLVIWENETDSTIEGRFVRL